MPQRIAQVTVVVEDYDEAISFYTQKLNFELLEDTPLSPEKRWVLVAPPGKGNCALLLAKANSPAQQRRVGDQAGGRVFLFLHTDDFWKEYNRLLKAGVSFVRNPSVESYGTVAVFRDLYGNLWDLVEPIAR